MSSTNSKIRAFQKKVLAFYKAQGRHALAWRKTRDPYKVLVSEIMLQQTQVARVIPFYRAFLARFPNVDALARAPLSSVLRVWQGLGYNRRAKMLHQAAKAVSKQKKFPKSVTELEALPGIGPYTARAVAAFSFNQDVVFVETNIRTAVMHHFFPLKKQVSDKDIEAVLVEALPLGSAREWYSALMDYGAHLKEQGIRLNPKVKGYTKQSKFRGSGREARGAIVKALVKGPRESTFLVELLGSARRPQVRSQLAALTKEGMIILSQGKFRLAR